MAIPVLESSDSAASTGSASVTITKPTGLAVGDLLLVQLAASDIGGDNRTWSTPSGWTAVEVGGTTEEAVPAAYYIIATSTETAASNFTFSMSGTTTAISGVLMRISGHWGASPITVSEIDQTAGSTTSLTFTTALTPAITNSLLIFSFMGAGNAFTSGTPTIASYASTPSATWSEVADVGVKDGSDDGHGLGVAQADYSGLTQITSRTATINQTANLDYASIAIIVNGTVDANTTPTFVASTQSAFATTGSAGATTTLTLKTSDQTKFDPVGYGNSPPAFTNEAKQSTTFTNTAKQSTTYTNASKSSTTYTNQDKP